MIDNLSAEFAALKEQAERENWTLERALREAAEWKCSTKFLARVKSNYEKKLDERNFLENTLVNLVERHGLTGELDADLIRYAPIRRAEIQEDEAMIQEVLAMNGQLAIRGRQSKAAKHPRPKKTPDVKAVAIGAMRSARHTDHMTLETFIESARNGSIEAVSIEWTTTHGVKKYTVTIEEHGKRKTVRLSTLGKWWTAAGEPL